MPTPAHDTAVRGARDRMIDLLGIGDSYPLTDLAVAADQPKVAVGVAARITVDTSEPGVTYQLGDAKGTPFDGSVAEGDGGTAYIKSPPITANIMFSVLATKHPPLATLSAPSTPVSVGSAGQLALRVDPSLPGVHYQLCDAQGNSLGGTAPVGNGGTLYVAVPSGTEDVPYRVLATMQPQAARLLDQRAEVESGVDTTLPIAVLDAPPLNPANPNPEPSDARIVPYGTAVTVQVASSQEGVEYSLVIDGTPLANGPTRTGNLGVITLDTGPLVEDTTIQVRATKYFAGGDQKDQELDIALRVAVMASPTPAVTISSAPIVAYGGSVTVKVTGAQRSASYAAFVRPIHEREYVHDAAADPTLATTGQSGVQVRLPASTHDQAAPDGYLPLAAGVADAGTGDITFTVPSLEDDSLVIVQATKNHLAPTGSPPIPSSTWLRQGAAVLVRPDPDRRLRLRASVDASNAVSSIRVFDGQPGVFYHFRQSPTGPEFSDTAYFYKRDESDPQQNMGVGQLGVGIDFVIAADPDVAPVAGSDPATTPPSAPILDVVSLAAGSTLQVRGVKAQTALDVMMSRPAPIAPLPAIHAASDAVGYSSPATIVIPASAVGESYQISLAGKVRNTVVGTGGDLTVMTDPLTINTTFEVLMTTAIDAGTMTVERVISIPITVRPAGVTPSPQQH